MHAILSLQETGISPYIRISKFVNRKSEITAEMTLPYFMTSQDPPVYILCDKAQLQE